MKQKLIYTVTILFIGLLAFAQTEKKIYFDEDGKICTKREAQFYRLVTLDKNGKSIGKAKDYFITGELEWEGMVRYPDINDLSNEVVDGLCIRYFKNGNKEEEIPYVNGAEQGLAKEYYETGKIKSETNYVKGIKEGGEKVYYESGKIQTEALYVHGMAMVYVKGGTFTMGCTGEQTGCKDDEKPAHGVTVSSFNIGKYEITVAQFEAFIKATSYQTDAEKKGYSYILISTGGLESHNGIDWRHKPDLRRWYGTEKDENPVLFVSWNDAKEYCRWLSAESGKHFRLPTEAEWEYAARGGNESHNYQYSGSNTIDEVALNGISGKFEIRPVGQKQANELGLYDMSGNVWEWCADFYNANYYSSSPSSNPPGADSGVYRVVRGGCWYAAPNTIRVAKRGGYTPDDHRDSFGFRVAQDL